MLRAILGFCEFATITATNPAPRPGPDPRSQLHDNGWEVAADAYLYDAADEDAASTQNGNSILDRPSITLPPSTKLHEARQLTQSKTKSSANGCGFRHSTRPRLPNGGEDK
jgi:hypothetical protein